MNNFTINTSPSSTVSDYSFDDVISYEMHSDSDRIEITNNRINMHFDLVLKFIFLLSYSFA